eukprot:2681472-Rhodomonas_salina.2
MQVNSATSLRHRYGMPSTDRAYLPTPLLVLSWATAATYQLQSTPPLSRCTMPVSVVPELCTSVGHRYKVWC